MPITPFLRGQAFGPKAIRAMGTAFEDVLRELGLADKSDPLTMVVAKKIIELAERGERDPIRLRDQALTELKR